MDLPNFSSLWEAFDTCQRLEESLKQKRPTRERGRTGRRQFLNEYSDGICGVAFGLANPEAYNPLKTCCDQHFFTQKEYALHEAAHVKCPLESCSLRLHPSMLGFHCETAHSETPPVQFCEDAALREWRKDRKRFFPTFERVQAKIRETGYRIQRGQIFLTKEYAPLSSRRNCELRLPKVNAVESTRDDTASTSLLPDDMQGVTDQSQIMPPSCDWSPSSETLQSGSSTAFSLVARLYDSDSSEKEDCAENQAIVLSPKCSISHPTVQESETPANANTETASYIPNAAGTTTTGNSHLKPSRCDFSWGRGIRLPQRIARRQRRRPARGETLNASRVFASHPIVRLISKRKYCLSRPDFIHRRPTLSEMLYAEDIRHERNQLMQCVRFVVKEKFFL